MKAAVQVPITHIQSQVAVHICDPSQHWGDQRQVDP